MSCEYCDKYRFTSVHAEPRIDIGQRVNSGKIFRSNDIHYCPICGQYLGDNPSLTLDELKQIEGECVYSVYGIPHIVSWGFDDYKLKHECGVKYYRHKPKEHK